MPRLKKNAKKSAKIARMGDEMHKFKHGQLYSSSGQKVTNRKQAIAIGLSESGQSKKQRRKVGKAKASRHHYGHHAKKFGKKKVARKRA